MTFAKSSIIKQEKEDEDDNGEENKLPADTLNLISTRSQNLHHLISKITLNQNLAVLNSTAHAAPGL